MKKYYVTFGNKYASAEHPRLGKDSRLATGWFVVYANDITRARAKVHRAVGRYWAGVYDSEPDREKFTSGEIGRIE